MQRAEHRDCRLDAQADSTLAVDGRSAPYRLFWGDLHNHNAVGYARGSLSRSIDLARAHLDFFAFTGHASWHDMPHMPGDRHLKWVRGFEKHSEHWPRTQQLLRDANTDRFVALLGYEWHSSRFGDICLIHPGDTGELFVPDHVDRLLDFARQRHLLAIPHHVAYRQGWRGANWDHFQSDTSPVVEIFSEHGCTETDRSPFPMIRHSNGGRWTANTVSRQLARGRRFGFVASSDDHLGYPGAYGEGVLGVWAEGLTKANLFEAIRSRRCYAATGDRIALEVTLNGQLMGGQLPPTGDRQIDVAVTGQDAIASIELIRNGRVIQRHFPADLVDEPVRLPGRAKLRLQYGWGPWADLDLGRICDWEMNVSLDHGRIARVLPCFQSGPFDENRRDIVNVLSESELHLASFTSRVGGYAEDPTKSLVLEVEGAPEAVLSVQMQRPAEKTVSARLADLVDENVVEFTGVFTSESLILGRLVSPSEYASSVRWHDRRTDKQPDWYFVRVTQHNGHMAWSSPIWVG